MKLIHTSWTPEVNMHVIACDCGKRFEHRADRFKVRCQSCGNAADLGVLRDIFAQAAKEAKEQNV